MLVALNVVLVVMLIAALAMPLLGATGAFLLLVSFSRDKPLWHWSRDPWSPFFVVFLGLIAGSLLGNSVFQWLVAALAGGA